MCRGLDVPCILYLFDDSSSLSDVTTHLDDAHVREHVSETSTSGIVSFDSYEMMIQTRDMGIINNFFTYSPKAIDVLCVCFLPHCCIID